MPEKKCPLLRISRIANALAVERILVGCQLPCCRQIERKYSDMILRNLKFSISSRDQSGHVFPLVISAEPPLYPQMPRSRLPGPSGCTRSSTMVFRGNGNRVRLYSRAGNDLTYRFALIVEQRRLASRRGAGAGLFTAP